MNEIFIIQLANRAKKEADLLDKLPADIKVLVEEKLSLMTEQE